MGQAFRQCLYMQSVNAADGGLFLGVGKLMNQRGKFYDRDKLSCRRELGPGLKLNRLNNAL